MNSTFHPPNIKTNQASFNKYKGKRIFILGSGSSANHFDLSILKKEIVISISQFGRHPQIKSIQPNYHLIADPASFDPNNTLIFNTILESLKPFNDLSTEFFFPLPYAASTSTSPHYKNFKKNYYKYNNKFDLNTPIDFSKPIPWWGQNVMDAAIALSIHLGASQTYLIGFDNGGVIISNSDARFYREQSEFLAVATDRYSLEDFERCKAVQLTQLNQIQRYCKIHGHQIFTCSEHGEFKLFPYARFSALFRKEIIESCKKAQNLLLEGQGLDALEEISKWQNLGEYPNNYHTLKKRIDDFLTQSQDNIKPETLKNAYQSSTIYNETPSLVPQSIQFWANQDPQAECVSLLENGLWQTYNRNKFWEKVEHYTKLFASNCPANSLVLFIKKTDIDLLTAYIGAMNAGMQPAQLSPANSKTSAKEYKRKIEHILKTTQSEYIFTDKGSCQSLENSDVTFLFKDSAIKVIPQNIKTSDLALVQFSSGSTGLQKAVYLKHSGILSHMESYRKAINLNKSDRMVSWLPLYHDMGLIACYLMPLMEGIPVMMMDTFDWLSNPQILLDTISKYKATLCYQPNFAYHLLVNKCKPSDLSSMKAFVNCSEPAKLETHLLFQKKFSSVKPEALSVCYALAENTFAVSQTDLTFAPKKIQLNNQALLSCGEIIDNTQVKIFQPNADGVGEIHIAGQCTFDHFLDNKDYLIDGFYPTGDLGLIQDKQLYITGRKKDLIIVNGKNIYPQDIEFIASKNPHVYPGRAVCFGIINLEVGSEEIIVQVEPALNVDHQNLIIELRKSIELEVGILPKQVEIVPYMSLVKTSSGKISRSRNKELFLERNPIC